MCGAIGGVSLVQRNRLRFFAQPEIDHLHEYRKSHRKIDVAFWNMHIEPFATINVRPINNRKLKASILTVGWR